MNTSLTNQYEIQAGRIHKSYDELPVVIGELLAETLIGSNPIPNGNLSSNITKIKLRVYLQYVPTGNPVNELKAITISEDIDFSSLMNEFNATNEYGFKQPPNAFKKAAKEAIWQILSHMVKDNDLSNEEHDKYINSYLADYEKATTLGIDELSIHVSEHNSFHALSFTEQIILNDIFKELNKFLLRLRA